MKSLLVACLVLVPAAASAATNCTLPGPGDALPDALAKGPHLVAERTVDVGGAIDVDKLHLTVAKRFMPHHAGSKQGEWVIDLTGTLGPTSDVTTVPGTIRVGDYRIAARARGDKWVLRVEDGVCEKRLEDAPLAKGASRMLWLSSEGTNDLMLERDGDWFGLTLHVGFAPNGDYGAYASFYVARSGTSSKDIDLSDLPAKPVVLGDMRVDVVKVVWGPNTRLEQGEILPPEVVPVAHVLVKLSRR